MKKSDIEKEKTVALHIALCAAFFCLGLWNPSDFGITYDEPRIDFVKILNVDYERFYYENEYYYRNEATNWRWVDSSFEFIFFPPHKAYNGIKNKEKKIEAEKLINEATKSK